MRLHARKKVEIVVDGAETEKVLGIVERAGARGYTVVEEVTGRGARGIRTGHDIFDESPNSLVMVVCSEEVALRIVAEVRALLETRAGIVVVSDVQVAREDHF